MNSTDSNPQTDMTGSSHHDMKMAAEPAEGHMLATDDPANPQNWPIWKKVYVSAAASGLAFVVAFGATSYTVGLGGVQKDFNVSMTVSILGFSIYLWGIAFAPIHTPHLSERFGRQVVYLACYPIFMLFILGAAVSKTFASLMVTRFFAGFFGGPCLVLIEGTFADVWSANVTVTYYGALTLASFIGAGAGETTCEFTQINMLILFNQVPSSPASSSDRLAGPGPSGSP